MYFTRRRFLTVSGTTLSAGLPIFSAHGAALSGRQAINKSGQLRMLSQRILKAYAQLGLGLMPKESMNVLSRSVMMANGNLVDLRGAATGDSARATLVAVEKAWAELRDMVSVSPNKSDATVIAKLGDDLLGEADKMTRLFESAVGTEIAKMVSLAGRQRMLSQKVARHYFFAAWGAADKSEKLAFDKARAEFSVALETLKGFPKNSEVIQNRLTMLGEQWGFMLAAFTPEKMGTYHPAGARHVATASENILELADELTLFYENLKV